MYLLTTLQEFVEKTYHSVPKPNHLIYNSNCILSKHVKTHQKTFFDNVGLAVDVFHFDCKHSQTDTWCQEHCNPAAFPELMKEDGSWFFNTSIAEQTNVWLGGFHLICHEMTPLKYRFFLDQMIIMRNEKTWQKLNNNGYEPTYWPM